MLETLPMWSNVQPQLQPHLGKPLTVSANVLEIAAARVPRGIYRREISANRVLSTIESVTTMGTLKCETSLVSKRTRRPRFIRCKSNRSNI